MRGWLIRTIVLGTALAVAPPGSRILAATAPATTRPAARPVTAAGASPATTQPAAVPLLSDAGSTTRPAPLQYAGTTELSPNARLEVVGNKLIVSGTQQDLELIRMLVEAMEQTGPQMEIKLFSLKNAQAAMLSQTLQRLWSELARTLPQTPENQVTILPDQLSNTIIVAGTEPNIDRVGKLIEGIDNTESIVGQIKEWTPIQLKHIRASEAAEIVRQTLEKLQKQKGVTGPSPIDVQVDARHNSLLIIAPQKDIEQVHRLISIIDTPPTVESGSAAKLAVFPLIKANAEKVAKTLEDMIKVEGAQQEAAKEQIRRLQLLRMKPGTTQPAEELAALDLEKPIKIIADTGMNAVIIGTIESNIKPLSEIVTLLDTVPTSEEMVVRIFPLKNADAQNMLELLQTVFKQGKDLPEVPGESSIKRVPPGPAGAAMVYNVNVASDPRTNMLVVAGRIEQVAFAQKIIDEMDIEGIGVSFPVRVLRVEHADPDRLATIITDLNKSRMDTLKNRGVKSTEMEKVFIVADPRTDSLIVSAKEENFKEVQDLVTKLDLVPANYLGDIHILAVKNLTASDLGPKIEQLWERRIAMQGEKGKAVTDKPVIVTDTRSNALVIASNKEDYIAIEALVKQLEDQPLAPSSEIHLQVLKHNDAGKLGPQLQDLFKQRAQMRLTKGQEEQPSDRIAIVADATTNTLLIASNRENYDEIVRLLSQLDVPLDVAGAVRLYPLQHADATRAAKLLEELMNTKGIVRGAGGAGTIPEVQKKVSIVTDARSNALIVSATPENFAIVETLLKQIDTAEQPSVITPESRLFRIQYADAVKVADMLTKLFEGLKKALPQVEQDQMNMTVIAEDRSNTVIVTGSRFGMKRAEEWLEKIDRQPGTPSGEPKVYQLKYATAGKLADMLTDLFEKKRPTGESGNRTPVYILADEGSNSLIVTAPLEEHSIVTSLLQMLDRPSTLSQLMEIIPLQKAKAEDLSDTLTKVLEKQQTGAAKGTPFSIAAEPRTNSLIVFAGPDMMNNIRIIAEKLDTTQPIMELGLRVITLKQAKAEDLAKRLTDFLKEASTGGATGGGQTGSSAIINFKAFDEATQREVLRKLVQQDITITADARTNSLLVLAPADSADMLETLIRTLDAVKPITAEIQMFLLRNADAEETKDLLEELFQVGQAAGAGKEAERRLVIGGAEGGMLAASASGATAGSYELAFSVDKRTNTVIAAGSPEYLDIVAQVIDRLDSLDIQNRVQRIVKLRNGVAEDVAQTMESYFEAEQQAVEVQGAEESILRVLERQVTVQADKASNTIILSYNPRMEAQIVEMINKLDQQPPQVMIQVLLAEVTLDNNLELGMEFALQDLAFTQNATVGPNNTVEDNGHHFDVVAGTDVGAAGSGTGFSFTITGEDFNFLFHALQGDSRIDVLSRPSIMVADNEQANITVGTRVPVVQNVTVSTGGIVVPSVTYEKVGILLDVEPHINPDGYVNLTVKPTISDLGTSTVSVGSGINLPTFLERSAETVVTVRDGETIVIGGLIRTSDTSSENKAPIVGDVPILGNLFRASRRSRQKTELLIVLTPKVIRTEEEAYEISVKQRDQSGLLEKIRLSPLMEKLQVKPGEEGLGAEPGVPATQPGAPGAPEEPTQYGPPLNVYGPEAGVIEESDEKIEVAGLLPAVGGGKEILERGR